MQIKKYRLQSEMENLKLGDNEWFKTYLKEVLESNKTYYEKADYIAYSINQIQNKIDYISNEIKQLQAIKVKLSTSKEIAQEITATILQEYGITKLEGAMISSITIIPESSKTSNEITIKDDNKVMGLGFVKFSVDLDAVKKAVLENEDEQLKQYIDVVQQTTTTQAKIKINNKRTALNQDVVIDEILNNVA